MKKKIALLLACVMAFGIAVGGTLAWLTDKTDAVVNTFTESDVDITLAETTGTSYKMVPGYEITKDPKVTVLADSEKCYVFVKLEKTANFDDFMTYEMDSAWTKLEDGVYYLIAEDTNDSQVFTVLKDNKVSVKEDVTKTMMDGLTTANYPKLTVTAYASQYNKNATTNFSAADAWNLVKPTTAG